jgi:hypothetical protein
MSHETIELACIALGALALVMQAIALLSIAIGISKSTKQMKEQVEEMRSAVMPIVDTTRELLVRLTPKVESTVTDVSEMAHKLRAQLAEVEVAVNEILVRVQKQTSRLDTMFSGTLDAVDKASVFVAETVSKPVRQLSGLLAALKAIVESLQASDSAHREPNPHNDKDMFV